MDHDDPEKRIAELEQQLAEAKAAAQREDVGEPAPPPWPTPGTSISADGGGFQQVGSADASMDPQAAERIAALAHELAEFWHQQVSTGQPDEAYEHPLHHAHYARDFGIEGQAGPVDTHLAEPPRRIPAAFWLAELVPFRWWYIFALLMVATTAGVLAIWIPAASGVIAVATLLGIYAFQLRGTKERFALLRWGQVAQVTGTQIVSQGTYYSGTTWNNAVLPVAHGWKVMRPTYSGPSTKTRIGYTVNGSQGELVVSGREYIDGVVLADPRNPARALCVTSFTYDLDRDESGNWIGRIRPRLMVGMAVWLVLVIGWLWLAAFLALQGDRFTSWLCNLPGTTSGMDCSNYTSASPGKVIPTVLSVPQGGNLRVGGDNTKKTIACNDGNLTLYGSGEFTVTGRCASLTVGAVNSEVHVELADAIVVQGYNSTFDVTGHCASLMIYAHGNEVHLESVDTVKVSDDDNTVTYRSGSPEITDTGTGNLIIQQG